MAIDSASVRIGRTAFNQLIAEAKSQPAVECCGFLAGRAGIISAVLSAANALASATAYEIAPRELFDLFRRMREQRLDHLGIYHSHPRGDNSPSPTDVERAFYPTAVYLIISPLTDAPNPVRAFRLADGRSTELSIRVDEAI